MYRNKILLVCLISCFSGTAFADSPVEVSVLNNTGSNIDTIDVARQIRIINQKLENIQRQDVVGKLSDMQREIQQLRGTLETQAHSLRNLGLTVDSVKANTVVGNNAVVNNTSDVQNTSVGPVSVNNTLDVQNTSGNTVLSENDLYNKAFSMLKERDYTGAIEQFTLFLKSYPSGKHTINTHYWLGEIYLLKGNFTSAERHFLHIINDNNSNSKIPDSILKLAVVYVNTDRTDLAKKLVVRLQDNYPNSTAARMAKMQFINL